MKAYPTIQTRTIQLLENWRQELNLTNLEKYQLSRLVSSFDNQLNNLTQKNFRITAYGKSGVGKSSLLNALIKLKVFRTDIANGSTKEIKSFKWKKFFPELNHVEIIDTPGIDEINSERNEKSSESIAIESDLVLFVVDSDLTTSDMDAIRSLIEFKKPIILVLNKIDQWEASDLIALKESIKIRLRKNKININFTTSASSPRKAIRTNKGLIRSIKCSPQIGFLLDTINDLISNHGELFLSMNTLFQAERLSQGIKEGRLIRRKKEAQSIIGKYAALKASTVALSPFLAVDLASAISIDTALIIELSNTYDLHISGNSARNLLKRISLKNTLLAVAQIIIFSLLSIIKQLLLFISPITGGLSLASATPIALAQYVLAIYTTKQLGKLAAKEFLNGTQNTGIQPEAMLKRLESTDHEMKNWISTFSRDKTKKTQIEELLP